jgi:hypothetical protein
VQGGVYVLCCSRRVFVFGRKENSSSSHRTKIGGVYAVFSTVRKMHYAVDKNYFSANEMLTVIY